MLAEEEEEEESSSVVSSHGGSGISNEAENGGEIVVRTKTRRSDRIF